MLTILYVALGGAMGSALRYGIGRLFLSSTFPIGTLWVNCSGCFFMGLFAGLITRFSLSDSLKLFVLVGLLGAYTTFSTFGLDTLSLLKNGNYFSATLNMILSNALALFFVYLGLRLAQI